ncbi:MAG: hypothetical protein ABIS59_03495 [Candidatus Saccharibacteria bacterium]
MNLQLPTNFKPYLKRLSLLRTPIVGALLIGIFGYTAFVVNLATNVKSDGISATTTPKVGFDKATLKAVSKRTNVSGETALGTLGKSDPFAK